MNLLCCLIGHRYYLDLDGDHGGWLYCGRCGCELSGDECAPHPWLAPVILATAAIVVIVLVIVFG